jgi:Family of unknown function (DUF5317)
MFLGLVLLICIATVPLLGGRLGALAELRPRAGWLPMLAIAIQILIISVVPGASADVLQAAHLVSYALLGAFVWANRAIPGMALIALGGGSNVLVIAANGGVMPADPDLIAAASVQKSNGEFLNSAVVDHPRLAFLGDNLATPHIGPIHALVSVGDCVLVFGALVLLHVVCGSRLGRIAGRLRVLAPRTAPAAAR